MKILIIGQRMREYPRNIVLLDALAAIHQTTELEVKHNSIYAHLVALFRGRRGYDALLIVQPFREFVIPLLFVRLFLRTRVIGDAFTSLYDTFVLDRALARKRGIKAVYYRTLDWLFVHLCDTLLFDTEEHKQYFTQSCGLNATRALVVPVSVDMEQMQQVKKKMLPHAKPGDFQILFCGYFIPLQGVEHIIRAAHILRDRRYIRFTLLGGGQTKNEMIKLAQQLQLTNLTFMDPVPYPLLLSYTKGADCSLGVFGDSDKAKRVVANKIIETASVGVPLITGRSPAVGRFFRDGKSVFFAEMGDSGDLAKAIEKAYNTNDLMRIGQGGQEVVFRNFSKAHLCELLTNL